MFLVDDVLLGTLGSALWARLSDFTASHFWPSWSSKDPVYTPADPELAPKHTKDRTETRSGEEDGSLVL